MEETLSHLTNLIFVSVLAFNVIGDTIRDILDPQSKVR